MIEPEGITTMIAIFCRVGCCMMLLPGIASTRMPAPFRLMIALGISLALGPTLIGTTVSRRTISADLLFVPVLASECVVGIAIGIGVRIILSAVQFAGSLIGQVSGYGHPFSIDDGHGEPVSELSALLSTAVVAMLFVLDFHHLVIEALVESYTVIGFGRGIEPTLELERLSGAVSDSVRLALAVSVPFVLASMLINLAFGILNRMAPQLPVFFISSAFLMGSMLWLAWMLVPELGRAMLAAIFESLQRP